MRTDGIFFGPCFLIGEHQPRRWLAPALFMLLAAHPSFGAGRAGHATAPDLPVGALKMGADTSTTATDHDLLGWRGTRWGMSESQVAKLLQGEAEQPDSGEFAPDVPLVIRHYVVEGETLTVALRFGPSGLRGVVMSTPNTFVFADLERVLAKRYGPATDKTHQAGQVLDVTTSLWSFRSTSIELKRVLAPALKSWVMILYEPAKGSEAEKL